MPNINGFFVLLSTSDTPKINPALATMKYRAWNRFDVKNFGKICVGVCLANGRKYDDIIHGEFYDSIDLSREPKLLAEDLSEIDGSYALAIPRDDSVVFARDFLGTKPLYYGKDSNNFLLSTDPNALTVLGFKANYVAPGFLYEASIKRIRRIKFSSLRYETKSYDQLEAVETTTRLLSDSIKRRIANRNVVLGFGGGIDSTLIAKVASGSKMLAVTVCMKGSLDHKVGKHSAELLDIRHETVLVDETTVINSIRELQKVTQFKNEMHASIAAVVYILAKHTREKKYDVLMLGQLADELFGGYARYLKYLKSSVRKVREAMFGDIKNACRNNLDRDELAASFHTKLSLPYTAVDFVKYAISIPLRMKLDRAGRRKIMLVEVAKNIGVPQKLLSREKKAMQFSSGVYKVVSKLNL